MRYYSQTPLRLSLSKPVRSGRASTLRRAQGERVLGALRILGLDRGAGL